MKAAILVRVSSTNQAKDSKHSIPVQIAAARAYAETAGLNVLEEYVDALSGAHERRDNFYRLLADADRYKAVIIYHTDRIGRDEELSHRFLRLLFEAGLEVHSVHRGGQVERGLATSAEIMIAAEERRNIIRRTTAARRAMAEKGLLPTGIKAYGFLNASGKAIHHPLQSAIVRRIFQWSAEGKTQWWIQEQLNAEGVEIPRPSQLRTNENPLWHRTVISKMLRNRAYKGEYRWGKYPIGVPPIVSSDLWERAQPRKRGPRSSTGWPLVGHLRCGVCGRRMNSRSQHKDRKTTSGIYETYRCQSGSLPSGPCGAKSIRREQLEVEAEALARETFSNPDTLRQLLDEHRAPNTDLTDQLVEIDAEDKRWLEAFRLGAINPAELAQYRRDLEAKRRALLTPEAGPDYPLGAYAEAAQSAPFPELLEIVNVVFIATQGQPLRLTIE